MSDMSAQTRLFNRNGSYYFRSKIPVDLQLALGKTEEKFALGTKDYHEAKRLVREASVAFDRKCQALRERLRAGGSAPQQQLVLTDQLIQEICDLWSFHALEGDEKTRQDGLTPAEFQDQAQARSETETLLRQLIAQGQTDVLEPALQQYLKLLDIKISGDVDGWRRLRYRFLQTVTATHGLQRRRDNGEVVWTPSAPTTKAVGFVPASETSLQDLFADWKKFEADRPQKTVDDVERTITEFERVVGRKPADTVSRRDVMAYRDYLVQVAKRKSKTVQKKIALLGALFNVAIENEKLKTNPAWRIPNPKDDSAERELYDIDDLRTIFGSPLFTARERLGRDTGESAVWLPLLALLHGCREEELGQLLVADVAKVDGIWCLRITEDDGQPKENGSAKKLKNRTSKRRIPLHPKAVQAGFLRYVEQVRSAGHQRLFFTLRPDRYGKLTSGFSKAYHAYLREVLGITNRNLVFHSFRHTFRDACREAGIPEELADTLMGHGDQGKTGRRYGRRKGRVFSLRKLHEAICQIDYPGLDIPVVIPADE